MLTETGWRIVEHKGDQHVIPCGDLREHSVRDCACDPTPDAGDVDVIVHHSFDGREAYETGERRPS